MNKLAAKDFLGMAASHGLAIDAKYAHNWPRNLSFRQKTRQHRYWTPPPDPSDLCTFLHCIVEQLGMWNKVYLWPKLAPLRDALLSEDVDALTELARAMPDIDGDGAIVFERGEVPQLLDLLALLIEHGWSWPTDVFLVPDTFEACVMTDHHDALHVEFATSERCDAYVTAMETRGYSLPSRPPDDTFRINPDGFRVERL